MIEKDKKHTEANLIEIHGNSRASKFTPEQVRVELAKPNFKTAIEVKMQVQGKTIKKIQRYW
jgi:hypothetical protein